MPWNAQQLKTSHNTPENAWRCVSYSIHVPTID